MTRLPATRYRIVPRDANAHLFEVSCAVDAPDPAGQCLRLPTWVPGSYLIREFARHVVSVRAECRGAPVAIAKIAKDRWRAAPCDGPLVVVAEVYAFDLSVRAAYLDRTRGYFNGASVFLCPEGREAAACEVEIVASPDHPAWRVATTLPGNGAAPWDYGRYRAADYDELIDHPVELAEFTVASFEAGGAHHDIAISGRHDADLARVAADLKKVCTWQIDLFGGAASSPAPFERYLFQVMAVGSGYGGLEHRSSTSLICSRRDLPRPGAGISDEYRNFLGLASHEYFHAWNVKRIKPAAFTPYDLGRENLTRLLWMFEGFTSYYDDLALLRSGVIGVASYLELVGRTITGVLRTPGRHRQSVAESSFDAWVKFYRPDENTPNAVVSYYAKGALIALALDLELRQRETSLDALMRLLWQRYGRSGEGVPEDGIVRIATELAGHDLSAFFVRYVEGTEDLPLGGSLRSFGIRLELRAAEDARDRGGSPGKRAEGMPAPCTLGVKLARQGEAKLMHVFAGGPAAKAGFAGGDVLIAINGLRVDAASFDALIERSSPGERVTMHAFRRDELMSFEVTLEPAPPDTAFLTLDPDAMPEAIARRQAWLGTAPD